MKEVSIAKEKLGIMSCNVCYARNYDPDGENTFGVYKKDLYDLHIGSMCICLCKDCLKLIAGKIAETIGAEGNDTKGE